MAVPLIQQYRIAKYIFGQKYNVEKIMHKSIIANQRSSRARLYDCILQDKPLLRPEFVNAAVLIQHDGTFAINPPVISRGII